MRHLLLIFMIALLPLRAWTGDAMATGMLAAQVQVQVQQQTVAKPVAAHAHEAGTEAHQDTETVLAQIAQTAADCSGHASGADGHAADTHCESCAACQACHTVALTTTALGPRPVFNAPTRLSAAAAPFASADMAHGQKPPIS